MVFGCWSRCLDKVSDYFGDLRTTQFERTDKINPIIRRWRAKWGDRPRTADYHMQVLSRVCAYAVDPLAAIAVNPCEGIKHLYDNDRSEIIWAAEDIKQLYASCAEEIKNAVDLASHTGLRLGDLLKVS